jgi:iron-sulfur cluster insertion protein
MSFTVSDNAKTRITEILNGNPNKKVRLVVDSGGCAGFSYKFNLDESVNSDDLVFDDLIIDQISLDLLDTFQIEYIDDLSGTFFKLDIKKATSTCGCQTSFSL